MTVVVGFAALKATQLITLPLAFAVVLLMFFRPLQTWLDARLPHWISPIVVMLIAVGLLALGALAVAYAVSVVAPEVPRLAEQIRPQLENLRNRLRGVAEVGGYRRKLQRGVFSPANSEKVLDAFGRMTGKFSRYFLVQTFSSVVTGILTGLYCWVIGIEFPFVWGLLAAVLNFVPTIGSIVAVVPPTLFALAFGGLGTAALALVGLGVIQFTMGNAVDPALLR